jgi:hypothetical protein
METTIMAVTIDPRTSHAPQVQTVLTKHGCIIKTRVGLHEANENSCSESGLIILHLISASEEVQQLESELKAIEGITVKSMNI